MSTATGERGPNEPNNEKHSESIKQKTMGNTEIAYEAPVAKHTYVKTYVVRISQSTLRDFKIYRCANFAIYFGISECPWALLGRQ